MAREPETCRSSCAPPSCRVQESCHATVPGSQAAAHPRREPAGTTSADPPRLMADGTADGKWRTGCGIAPIGWNGEGPRGPEPRWRPSGGRWQGASRSMWPGRGPEAAQPDGLGASIGVVRRTPNVRRAAALDMPPSSAVSDGGQRLLRDRPRPPAPAAPHGGRRKAGRHRLADQGALVPRQGPEDGEQLALGRGGGPALGERAEGDAALLELLDDAQQVGQRSPSLSNFHAARVSPRRSSARHALSPDRSSRGPEARSWCR